jgi:hypothetical protein
LGKIEHTGERFSWYRSDDVRVKVQPPSCRQYKAGNFLAIRPLNWDVVMDEDDYGDNWADHGEPGSDGGVMGIAMTMTTMRVMRTRRAVRKGPGKGMEQRTARGHGWATVKGKILLNKPQGEMISLVPWLCSCRSKCQRHTSSRRAN